jgi:GT2 family glycosyltransferase
MILFYQNVAPYVADKTWVSIDTFYRHLCFLEGRPVVPLHDYNATDPAQCVIILQENGIGIQEYAVPLLRRFGMPFTWGDASTVPGITRATETMDLPHATVGVAITSYNQAAFLVEAIESVLRQTRVPDVIYISDDGSTDTTHEILDLYEASYPGLIRCNRNTQNMGVVPHFNKIVSLLETDFVALLGADDRLASTYVERCARALQRTPQVAIAYSDYYLFGSKARIVYKNFHHSLRGECIKDKFYAIHFPEFDEESKHTLLTRYNFIHGTAMYRRDIFQKIGGYREPALTKLPEDYDLFQRMILEGYSAEKIDSFLEYRHYSHEQTSAQFTSQNTLNWQRQYIAKLQKELDDLHRGNVPFLRSIRYLVKRSLKALRKRIRRR